MKHLLFTFILFISAALALLGQDNRITENFDFNWKFQLGDVYKAKDMNFDDSHWRNLNVPHDWSIEQEFNSKYASCTGYLPGGIGWYRKTFMVPENYKGKTVVIEFDGVYNNSEVWINGHYLGIRPYGFSSFAYNLTPYLNFGKENLVSVRVDHSKSADTRWYSGSGIYRHVRLVVTNPVHVAKWGTFVSTPEVSANKAKVEVKTQIANDLQQKGTFKLISTIVTKEGKEIAKTENSVDFKDSLTEIKQSLVLYNPVLWGTENPYLYTLVTTLSDGNLVVDNYKTDFGVRTLEFNPDKGFFLNGKNLKLKGVCLHHDGGCVGAAVPEKIWKIRLEKLKAVGCNAIRTSHNPAAPEFLDLCDKMGFLVMDEAFDEWEYPKKKWINGWNNTIAGYEGYWPYFRQWAKTDLRDMVLRDRNHPSIIMWSIGNEIDYANDPYADMNSEQEQKHQGVSVYSPDPRRMLDIAREFKSEIKALDQTRPVTMALANIGNSRRIDLPSLLDVVGYNYTESRYEKDHKNNPGEFIYGSENPHNYNLWLAVKNNDYISAQFLWTGIDYMGEAGVFPIRSAYSGLLDLTGYEKSIYYWRQSMWIDQPMVYITGRKKNASDNPELDPMGKLAWFVSAIEEKQHWNYMPGDTVLVTAFTNCAEAELYLNGKSLGKKKYNPSNSSIWWYVPYQTGEVKVVAKIPKGQPQVSYLKTVSEPVSLKLKADAPYIKADGQDVALVEVYLVDKNGNTALTSSKRVDFTVTGEGSILATDNGDAACLDNFKLTWRKAFNGRCIAIVQSNGKKGNIKVTARAEGLPDASIEIKAE
ncbi:MAG: glycoside hydrolase family 2 TIM barrel-domain containing protein [Bacteroidales bacterium]